MPKNHSVLSTSSLLCGCPYIGHVISLDSGVELRCMLIEKVVIGIMVGGHVRYLVSPHNMLDVNLGS